MTLEVRETGGKQNRLVLTACPLCGHRFRPMEQRSEHIFSEHTPRDVPALAGGERA